MQLTLPVHLLVPQGVATSACLCMRAGIKSCHASLLAARAQKRHERALRKDLEVARAELLALDAAGGHCTDEGARVAHGNTQHCHQRRHASTPLAGLAHTAEHAACRAKVADLEQKLEVVAAKLGASRGYLL